MVASPNNKYTFSGHDSFQCRQLWLKKGFDFASKKRSFNDASAVVELGVGKNMVASIRYWLRAFNIIDINDQPTQFGAMLLGDNGWDPYLEDHASLWLLHYQLVKSGVASIYHIIFTQFRKERIEFTRDVFVNYMKRRSEIERSQPINLNTVADDFDVFRKMYLAANDSGESIEDGFAGLLCDLNLLKAFKKADDDDVDTKKAGKKQRVEYITIEDSERPLLPNEVFLYAIATNEQFDKSISFQSLEQNEHGPGNVFALSRTEILERIEAICSNQKNKATFSDDAGIRELQFRAKLDPITILNDYYGR